MSGQALSSRAGCSLLVLPGLWALLSGRLANCPRMVNSLPTPTGFSIPSGRPLSLMGKLEVKSRFNFLTGENGKVELGKG